MEQTWTDYCTGLEASLLFNSYTYTGTCIAFIHVCEITNMDCPPSFQTVINLSFVMGRACVETLHALIYFSFPYYVNTVQPSPILGKVDLASVFYSREKYLASNMHFGTLENILNLCNIYNILDYVLYLTTCSEGCRN